MDVMVHLEKMVYTGQKGKTVTLAILVHVVQRDSVSVALDLLELKVKWVIKEEKYINCFVCFHMCIYIIITG